MKKNKKLSILSAFLSAKVKAKGWSKKEFIEQTGLSKSYAYELLSDNRDAIPSNEILDKVSSILGLTDKEGKYILDYTYEPMGDLTSVAIRFRKPDTYREDPKENLKEYKRTRNIMIKDIIKHVENEHNIQLVYTDKIKK